MKCNLAAPSLLSIVPASSLAPLALGTFATASALATRWLDTGTARSRHGRRSHGRAGARTDRCAEKDARRSAPSAAVGLPEATAEIIASLGEHRVLSTEQVRTIHLPGRSLRRTQHLQATLSARSPPGTLAVPVGCPSKRPPTRGWLAELETTSRVITAKPRTGGHPRHSAAPQAAACIRRLACRTIHQHPAASPARFPAQPSTPGVCGSSRGSSWRARLIP